MDFGTLLSICIHFMRIRVHPNSLNTVNSENASDLDLANGLLETTGTVYK
jgi:hypothetical protein